MGIERSSSLVARARLHAALGDPGRLAIVDALGHGDASPGELGRLLGMPTNLVAHHLWVLADAGLVTRRRSEGDRRRTYLHLAPRRLTGLVPPRLPPAPRVVFVCTRNSARSQLAAAEWSRRSTVPVASAGTRPAARVHPGAIRVGRRHGLTMDPLRTAGLAEVLRPDDLVVAVCDTAHEQLDRVPGPGYLHWSVPDPATAESDQAFEAAFTDLADRIGRLHPALTRRPAPEGTR